MLLELAFLQLCQAQQPTLYLLPPDLATACSSYLEAYSLNIGLPLTLTKKILLIQNVALLALYRAPL